MGSKGKGNAKKSEYRMIMYRLLWNSPSHSCISIIARLARIYFRKECQ
jgi:hypothetical protein